MPYRSRVRPSVIAPFVPGPTCPVLHLTGGASVKALVYHDGWWVPDAADCLAGSRTASATPGWRNSFESIDVTGCPAGPGLSYDVGAFVAIVP